MKRIFAIFFVLLFCLILAGCSVFGPKQPDVPKRVKTLGVVPVLIDTETIDYSNRDGLIALLEETNREIAGWLVEDLRKKGDYFDVRLIDAAPDQLFSQIISERTPIGEGNASRFQYSFNPAGVTEVIDANLVDALLVVVINGVKRPEKRWNPHSTLLEYLKSDYRSLLYTAAVVAPPSEPLWVRKPAAGAFFLQLDYPDFGEAFWNKTDKVLVKEITLPGLQRTLAEIDTGYLVKTTTRPMKYDQMVRELVDQLKKGM